MSAPAGPMPAPDMSNVDPGLQPTLIALLYLFPALALAVLTVRFWKKYVDHILGGGKTRRSSTNRMVTDARADDVLIAIAWMLSLANSIITHYCKNYRSLADDHQVTKCAVVKAMYTGYRTEDVPYDAIDMKHAFKVSTDVPPARYPLM